jgi:hypothetical protein
MLKYSKILYKIHTRREGEANWLRGMVFPFLFEGDLGRASSLSDDKQIRGYALHYKVSYERNFDIRKLGLSVFIKYAVYYNFPVLFAQYNRRFFFRLLNMRSGQGKKRLAPLRLRILVPLPVHKTRAHLAQYYWRPLRDKMSNRTVCRTYSGFEIGSRCHIGTFEADVWLPAVFLPYSYVG